MSNHVLLVDDNVFNREGMRLFLERQAYFVAEAGDEASAWELAGQGQFDAAVIDISIPPDPRTAARRPSAGRT